MKLGDTFVWGPTGGIDHLWILISDPAANNGDCVVINLTESSHGKYSYTLKPGQHRYIYKHSDVNFGDAFKTHVDEISAHVASGSARPHDPMDVAIPIGYDDKPHGFYFPRKWTALLPSVPVTETELFAV